MKTRIVAGLLLTAMSAGCASEYTIVDRSHFVPSDNSRVSSRNLIPGGQKHPQIVEQLAVAQEVYEKQLNLLKERRNKIRARRRTMDLTSFSAMAIGALATGYMALAATNKADPKGDLKAIGATSLIGLGLGTGLQIGGLMQEEVGSVDDKTRHLQQIYDAMLENLRTLAVLPESESLEARMGSAIEAFINQALQINIKG